MVKKEVMIVADYSQIEPISLDEVCQLFHISENDMHELITNEIIFPSDASANKLMFDLTQLPRIKRALRLHHDLEINFTTVALIMDLLDEMDELRTHVELIKKHYFYR